MGEGRRHRSLISRMKRVTGSENFGYKKLRRENRTFRAKMLKKPPFRTILEKPLSLFLSLSVPLVPSFVLFSRTSLLSPTWLRITLLCIVSSWLVNFLPAFSPSRPSSSPHFPLYGLLFLFRDSSSSSSSSLAGFLLLRIPSVSPVFHSGGRPVTRTELSRCYDAQVERALEGRHSSPPARRPAAAERSPSLFVGPTSSEVFSDLTRYIRGIFALAASRVRDELRSSSCAASSIKRSDLIARFIRNVRTRKLTHRYLRTERDRCLLRFRHVKEI